MHLLLSIAVFVVVVVVLVVVAAIAASFKEITPPHQSANRGAISTTVSGGHEIAPAHAEPKFRYQQIEELFTPAELNFYHALREATPDLFAIFGKVRVADVLKPERDLDRSRWQKSFNKISGKHFDFVLCEAHSGRTVCGVELNDKSHQRKNRQDRDAFLLGACKSAEFPLLVVQAARHYDVTALGGEIRRVIMGDAPPLPPPPAPAAVPPLPAATETAQQCPQCGNPLVVRTAQRGPHVGRAFLSCANYSHCGYVRAL